MSKHIADQSRDRTEGARAREFTRIERERGVAGPHPSTGDLQRRTQGPAASGRRTEEFLRRERDPNR
jgi:hypothetical protein